MIFTSRSPLVTLFALVLGAFALPVASPLAAQEQTPLERLEMPAAESGPAVLQRVTDAPPLRLAERFGVAPMAELPEASAGAGDQLAALQAWNDSGRRPRQAGIVRPLPLATRVELAPGVLRGAAGHHGGGVFVRSRGDGLVWAAEVAVRGARSLKLHLADVELPAGTRLWVYGESGPAKGPFGRDSVVDGGLWTPLVAGPVIRLEVEVPGGETTAARFTIDTLAEVVNPPAGVRFGGGPLAAGIGAKVDSSCLANAACVSDDLAPVDVARRATALYFFVSGNRLATCTGGLLNSASGSLFFLTANHCVSTRAAAASADLFWDYIQDCEGEIRDFSESFGAELLATDPSSDFSLMELDFVPPGRALLGWNGDPGAVTPGVEYFRISHPVGDDGVFPQGYSTHRVLASPMTCSASGFGAPPVGDLDLFTYSDTVIGGTLGGSSGAPLVSSSGQVVGQLLGACGPNPSEGCDRENQVVDGRFSNTLGFVGSYLSHPEGDGFVPPPAGAWLRSGALPGFEGKVRISSAAAVPGSAEADCIPDTLCASGALAGRPEVFVKVIGPRGNGFLWVQISRFTPSKVEVWLRQIATGEINYYLLDAVPNSGDDVSGLLDREAFAP